MPALSRLELRMIGRALMDPAYADADKHFRLTMSEAMGYVATARAMKCAAPQHDESCANQLLQQRQKALVRARSLIEIRILENPAYDQFKTAVAGTDPLGTIPPYRPGEVGPGQ
jgi:hypothetical protein